MVPYLHVLSYSSVERNAQWPYWRFHHNTDHSCFPKGMCFLLRISKIVVVGCFPVISWIWTFSTNSSRIPLFSSTNQMHSDINYIFCRLIEFCLTSLSIIFHSYGDITTAVACCDWNGLNLNFSPASTFRFWLTSYWLPIITKLAFLTFPTVNQVVHFRSRYKWPPVSLYLFNTKKFQYSNLYNNLVQKGT